MFTNVSKVFRYLPSALSWIMTTLTAIVLWYLYSEIDYVAANYESHTFAYVDMALSWGVIVLFPLLIAAIVYRGMHFGIRASGEQKSGFFGVLGGIVGVFITGASCCGITLVSVLGLSSLIGWLEIFPYHGVEIKALGLLMLLYATYDIYAYLEECKIRKKG